MLIEINQAVFGYSNRPIVRVERLELHPGKCLGIFGPNGAGKTTLVRGMVGLLQPLNGTVQRQSEIRLGYLPQHRAMDLNWPMTGLDAAFMATSARKWFGWVGLSVARVRQSMRAMEVDDLADKPFAKLSGGQQQRLLLAGALATDPQLLVLDEPTDGLDVRSRRGLLDRLQEHVSAGLCAVVISHEVEDLLLISDQIAWLHRPDDPEHPSHVETIKPDELADRVSRARQQR